MNLIGLSIARPTFLTMLTLFLFFVGAMSLLRLPVDLYPEVNYPVIAVRTQLKGAAPQEVEELVTKKLEDTLSTLSGIKSLRSMSREGSSFVMIEFGLNEDIRYQETQVRAKVGNIRDALPDEIAEPVVSRQDPDASPIVEVSLTGKRPASQLTDIANKIILPRLRQIAGVGDIEINGERDALVDVSLRPEALDAWKINASDVVNEVRKFQQSQPIGKVEGKERSWVIRTFAEARTLQALEAIPVGRSQEGTPIYLRDVATIRQSFSDVRRVGRFNTGDGLQAAVLLLVTKQSGENTVAVSDAVRQRIAELAKELPADCELRITRDNAETIRMNVLDVFETLLIAALLTVAVVLLFLRSPRSTLTTGLALPSSIITTFSILYLAGFTLNIMTLLALSLAIGLVVDDAIVVRENIFRHMQNPNLSSKEAAYIGTREVSLAVIATTLTLVAMFLPISTMSTLIGQFFKPFALTVVFAMLVSLWDALTMAPLLSAYFANIRDPATEWNRFGGFGRALDRALVKFEHSFERLALSYQTFLRWSMSRIWFALLVAAVSIAVGVGGFFFVKKSFLPTQYGQSFNANLDGPLAVPLAKILATADSVDAKLSEIKELESWTISSGVGWGGAASINVTMRIKPEAAKSEARLLSVRDKARRALSDFAGYRTRISEPADPLSVGGGGGRFQPISLSVTGENLDTLLTLYKQVANVLQNQDGVTDVNTFQEEGIPEARFQFDSILLGKFGLSPTLVSQNMAIWVQGDSSISLRQGDTQLPIRFSLAGGKEMSAAELGLRNIYSRSADGRQTVAIPVANFSKVVAAAGPATITRENRQRVLRISAGLKGNAALGDILAELRRKVSELPRPLGYNVEFIGQAQQMRELYRELATALGIGSIFVYMVLASLFESLVMPLAVMSAIPLAASGAALALLVFGVPLDLYGGIGIILLAGIVAKNSILLVDFALERMRREKLDPVKAVLETAPLRLRPILMTSAAMIAGMLPVAIGIGAAGATRRALGLATIGGVVSSTVLSLVIVPTLFVIVERVVARFRKPRAAQS